MFHEKNRDQRYPCPASVTFFVFFAIFVFTLVPAKAEESGITTFTELELQAATSPAVKLVINQGFIFPFLQGTGPLTRGNNITAVLSADFTPVSVNGMGEVNWTPAALFYLSGGGRIGSGWNLPIGYGIGINRPYPEDGEYPRGSRVDGSAFDGLLWSTWGAATLQFDLGAVLPGYWNHILFQTRQEFRYSAYTRARRGEPWVFENDFRENQNGWVYHASYVIGYAMPGSPVLRMIAFMAELERPLYNTPGGEFWGDRLGYWILSGILNFSIAPRLETTLAVQFHTRRNHGNRNFNTDINYFYRDLALQHDGGSRRLLFYRVGLIINYRLR